MSKINNKQDVIFNCISIIFLEFYIFTLALSTIEIINFINKKKNNFN
jgi:hypothetical protein